MILVTGDDAYKPEEDNQPVPLTQGELNNLIWELNLSKESAQLLDSCLKEKYLLAPGTTFYWYQDCERELKQFFMFQDKSSLVYCNKIAGLFKSMGLEYDAMEWWLFIVSSSRRIKADLLHNWNSFSSLPIGHSVQMKETHNSNGSFACLLLTCRSRKWLICGDLKVVRLVLRLHSENTKYPCFLYLWESQADDQHYVRQKWLSRQGSKSGSDNIQFHPFIELNKILLPPLQREGNGQGRQ